MGSCLGNYHDRCHWGRRYSSGFPKFKVLFSFLQYLKKNGIIFGSNFPSFCCNSFANYDPTCVPSAGLTLGGNDDWANPASSIEVLAL